MSNLGKEVADKLDIKAKQLATEIVERIFNKVKEHEEDPLSWPLSIEEEIKSVSDKERVISLVIRELENQGFIYIDGNGFDAIDVLEEPSHETEGREFIRADHAKKLSDKVFSDKLFECSCFVFGRIEEMATEGETRLVINTNQTPLNGNANLIKKIIKKLISVGFEVYHNDKAVDVSARPDYSEMKKLVVLW